MNNYNTAICIVGICLVITALVIFINHLRTKKTIDTIENMLNEAAKGNFSEKSFDETRLSSLETRFAHYLSASVVSARNVELEKDKIKSLIADISHQTKTPIANLLLYSELLLEDDTDNLSVQMRENIVQIHAQSEKLQFLIASLVKLSRLENGILQLSPQEEALKSMLTLAVKETEFKARAKGLELILHDTDEKAYFDSKWTLEAICNILDNALKYTNEGTISLSVTAYEMFVRIDIKDSGIGIKEEELPKIFSRFYRSEDTITVMQQAPYESFITIKTEHGVEKCLNEDCIKPPKSGSSYRTIKVPDIVVDELYRRREKNKQYFKTHPNAVSYWRNYICIGFGGELISSKTVTEGLYKICKKKWLTKNISSWIAPFMCNNSFGAKCTSGRNQSYLRTCFRINYI